MSKLKTKIGIRPSIAMPIPAIFSHQSNPFDDVRHPYESQKQIIYGTIPSKSNCYIIINFKSKESGKSHASLAKTKALKQYENDFAIQCNKYRNKNIDDYFTLEVDVYYPNQRSDLDNCLKILLDCLQKVGAISNDNKCTRIVANKFLDKHSPRIAFTIKKSFQ